MGSVRLDPQIQEKVRQAAAAKGVTQSEIHRQALAECFEREMSQEKTSRYDDPFYDSIFGAGEGPADLSRRHKEYYAEIIDEKYESKKHK